jgi:serine protease Do
MRGFGEIAERLRRSTVQVVQPRNRGVGSGVVASPDGIIVTNAHVARGSAAKVVLWDGRSWDAAVTVRDARRDLAALRISAIGLEAAALADSNRVRPGELAIAVGSPLGFAGALSSGVIHSIGALSGMGPQRWIRAAVQLAPGNSGGPLANASGEVIGINTAIVNGLGVAVPSNDVAEFLRSGGRHALGVVLRPVPRGLLIVEIDKVGAGAVASLRVGDVILGSYEDLTVALDSGAERIRLPYLRDGRVVREATVEFTARSEAA